MAEDDSTGGEVGRVIDVTRPEILLVETGLLGETLRALTKTDDHYGLALNAWRYQWGTQPQGQPRLLRGTHDRSRLRAGAVQRRGH
jgi:hypothetical protein